jgi:hypothetical protein
LTNVPPVFSSCLENNKKVLLKIRHFRTRKKKNKLTVSNKEERQIQDDATQVKVRVKNTVTNFEK